MGIRTRENADFQVVVKVLVTVTVYALFMWDAHCQDGMTIANKNTTNTSTVKISVYSLCQMQKHCQQHRSCLIP